MVTVGALWMPILLSAVIVFFVSFLVWNVLPWHKKEWKGLPNEEAVRQAMKDVPAGMYNVPHPATPKEMKDPAFQRKCSEGPMVMMSVMPKGMPSLGKALAIWFLYLVLVNIVLAYVAGRSLPAGVLYLEVFRLVGTVAWLTYGAALIQQSVWFGQPWRSAFWQQFDALMYGLLTAGVFGWLWPAAAAAT